MSRLSNRTARLRQLEELLLLATRGLSVADLSRQLRVHRRTIYRDLDFLSAQGVPIWQEAGLYGLNRARYLATVRLTYPEAMALVLAGLLLARTLDKQNPYVIAALHRLAASLPEFPSLQLKRAADRVETYRQDLAQAAILDTILTGWGSGQKVMIAYRSPNSGSLRQREIAPYALEPTPTGLYVICHDDWADDIRTFKLERLEHAQLLSASYTIPDDFDPDEYLSSSWGIMTGRAKSNGDSESDISEVVLHFTSAARPYVLERQWHPSQQVEVSPQGDCLLRVRVSEPLEMQPWIRSWGAQVEVLEPDWLRVRIADELRLAAEQYDTPVPAHKLT